MGLHHHDHSGGHHSHEAPDFGRAFAIGIGLNILFVAVEAGYGLIAGSMALMADAGHNLSDVLGLVIAWGGATLAKKSPTRQFTYGFKGSSILAALFNAVILLVALGAIMMEAARRLIDPAPVDGAIVMAVAAVGVLINGGTALLFARGRHGDINIRGAYLHMAADAAISVGVVLAGYLMLRTGLLWIDPVVSLIVAAFILWGTVGLLKESLSMSLAAVPKGIDPHEVEDHLADLPGVTRVHDLHIWPMSTTETALTAHLVMPAGHPGDEFLYGVQSGLSQLFHIGHATIQIEVRADGDCGLEPACRV